MENFFVVFPHNGKNVSTLWKKWPRISTQWKNISSVFHTMEKLFPQCGKTSSRDLPHGGPRRGCAAVGGEYSGVRIQ
jgi:hypothetical protein